MKNRTNIQIEHETLEEIKKEKNERETYDDVINRLLKNKKWQETEKMELYLGEFLDRLSILLHKSQKIGPEAYPEFIRYIQYFLLKIPEDNFGALMRSFRKLYYINGEIWKLESDIRLNKEKKLGLQETGRRAIKIRELNNRRLLEQNKVISMFGGYENVNPRYWEKLKKEAMDLKVDKK